MVVKRRKASLPQGLRGKLYSQDVVDQGSSEKMGPQAILWLAMLGGLWPTLLSTSVSSWLLTKGCFLFTEI